MAKEPITIFSISNFFTSDSKWIHKGLKAFDAGRVLTAALNETGVLTGNIRASFKKDLTYSVTVSFCWIVS